MIVRRAVWQDEEGYQYIKFAGREFFVLGNTKRITHNAVEIRESSWRWANTPRLRIALYAVGTFAILGVAEAEL